ADSKGGRNVSVESGGAGPSPSLEITQAPGTVQASVRDDASLGEAFSRFRSKPGFVFFLDQRGLRSSAAIRSLGLLGTLQRNISVLLRRILVALGLQHLQPVDEPFARLARLDHSINIAALGSDVRIGKALAELFH